MKIQRINYPKHKKIYKIRTNFFSGWHDCVSEFHSAVPLSRHGHKNGGTSRAWPRTLYALAHALLSCLIARTMGMQCGLTVAVTVMSRGHQFCILCRECREFMVLRAGYSSERNLEPPFCLKLHKLQRRCHTTPILNKNLRIRVGEVDLSWGRGLSW